MRKGVCLRPLRSRKRVSGAAKEDRGPIGCKVGGRARSRANQPEIDHQVYINYCLDPLFYLLCCVNTTFPGYDRVFVPSLRYLYCEASSWRSPGHRQGGNAHGLGQTGDRARRNAPPPGTVAVDGSRYAGLKSAYRPYRRPTPPPAAATRLGDDLDLLTRPRTTSTQADVRRKSGMRVGATDAAARPGSSAIGRVLVFGQQPVQACEPNPSTENRSRGRSRVRLPQCPKRPRRSAQLRLLPTQRSSLATSRAVAARPAEQRVPGGVPSAARRDRSRLSRGSRCAAARLFRRARGGIFEVA